MTDYPRPYYAAIPQELNITLAAALCGLSRKAFRARYLESGLVPLERLAEGRRPFISRAELEQALGREIDLDDINEAYGRGFAKRLAERKHRRQAALSRRYGLA